MNQNVFTKQSLGKGTGVKKIKQNKRKLSTKKKHYWKTMGLRQQPTGKHSEKWRAINTGRVDE